MRSSGPNRIHKKPTLLILSEEFQCPLQFIVQIPGFIYPLGYSSHSEVRFVPFLMPGSSPAPEAAKKAQPRKKQSFKTIEQNLSNINVSEAGRRAEVGWDPSSSSPSSSSSPPLLSCFSIPLGAAHVGIQARKRILEWFGVEGP